MKFFPTLMAITSLFSCTISMHKSPLYISYNENAYTFEGLYAQKPIQDIWLNWYTQPSILYLTSPYMHPQLYSDHHSPNVKSESNVDDHLRSHKKQQCTTATPTETNLSQQFSNIYETEGNQNQDSLLVEQPHSSIDEWQYAYSTLKSLLNEGTHFEHSMLKVHDTDNENTKELFEQWLTRTACVVTLLADTSTSYHTFSVNKICGLYILRKLSSMALRYLKDETVHQDLREELSRFQDTIKHTFSSLYCHNFSLLKNMLIKKQTDPGQNQLILKGLIDDYKELFPTSQLQCIIQDYAYSSAHTYFIKNKFSKAQRIIALINNSEISIQKDALNNLHHLALSIENQKKNFPLYIEDFSKTINQALERRTHSPQELADKMISYYPRFLPHVSNRLKYSIAKDYYSLFLQLILNQDSHAQALALSQRCILLFNTLPDKGEFEYKEIYLKEISTKIQENGLITGNT